MSFLNKGIERLVTFFVYLLLRNNHLVSRLPVIFSLRGFLTFCLWSAFSWDLTLLHLLYLSCCVYLAETIFDMKWLQYSMKETKMAPNCKEGKKCQTGIDDVKLVKNIKGWIIKTKIKTNYLGFMALMLKNRLSQWYVIKILTWK